MEDISQALDRIRSGGQQQTMAEGQPEQPQQGQVEQPNIASALDSLRQGSTGQQGLGQSSLAPMELEAPAAKSPIGVIDRLTLSFADQSGREKFLKDRFQLVEQLPNGKFAVGSTPDDLLPIDPEGIFNDVVGDLADFASEIPVIAGQIIGGSIGTVGATPGVGTFVGGAAGAGVGSAVKVGIGKALGVREENAMSQATDIAIDTAFGAVGEGINAGLKGLGKKALLSKATKGIDDMVKASADPTKKLKALGHILHTTAQVNTDDVVTAGVYEFNKTLGSRYMDKQLLNKEIMPKFVKGIVDRQQSLGKAVERGRNWAISKFGNKTLNISENSGQLLKVLSDPSVGIVDDVGRLSRGAFIESKDFRTFKGLSNLFFSENPKTGQLIPKNLKLGEYLSYKKRMGPALDNFFQGKTANPIVEKTFAQYFSQVDDIAKAATTPGGFITPEIAERNPFIKSNNAFSKWRKDIDLLKQNGLDVRSAGDLENAFRDGKVLNAKLEKFADGLQKKTASAKEAFKVVADQLPVKFEGGGVGGSVGTLTDELNKYGAAQGFNDANLNLLRFGMVASLLGGLGVVRGEVPKPVEIGGALLLGTPAGARITLKALSGMSKAPKSIAKIVGKRMASGSMSSNAAMLSEIAKTASKGTRQQ